MRTRAGLVGASIAALLFGARGARAEDREVCADARRVDGGPLAGGTDAADYGAIPESCAATDLGLRLRGTALVASSNPDFFGAVVATSTLRLRQRLARSSWTWLTVAADLTTYRYVVNGPASSQSFAFGPLTVGLHRALGAWATSAATVYGRVLLPLDTSRQNGARVGFELGLTGRRLLGARGRAGVQGGVAMLAPLDIIGGQTHPAFQPVALLEGWFAPSSRAALAVGVTGKAEVSPDAALLTVAPRISGRLAFRHGLAAAMLIEIPAVGEDRTDVVAAFYMSWAAPD